MQKRKRETTTNMTAAAATTRQITSAVAGFSIPDTRNCLTEIRETWRLSHPENLMTFSKPLESAPPLQRPITMERFATLFVAGQVSKRKPKKGQP